MTRLNDNLRERRQGRRPGLPPLDVVRLARPTGAPGVLGSPRRDGSAVLFRPWGRRT
jgi:hypothetical protein